MPKRKHYTAEFKARVVLELLTAQKGLMKASRDYGIIDTILSRWKKEFLERAQQTSFDVLELFGRLGIVAGETEVEYLLRGHPINRAYELLP